MKKFTHTLLLFLLTSTLLYGQAFITTWKTDNPGSSSDNQITIPTNGTGYNYDIDWGDGENDTGVTGDITHTYDSPGTYTVMITGDFPEIYFDGQGDNQKILTVQQWGNIAWRSMSRAFRSCFNLDITATDAPNLSGAARMTSMFSRCTSLTADLDNWDVSNITHMNGLFSATDYSGDISTWDTGSVTTMLQMFSGASFNGDISGWDVSNVTSMNSMFANNEFFNQDISGWNSESLTNSGAMFIRASAFNQDLSGWDMSNVTVLDFMFSEASSFDQDLSDWDVSNVGFMRNMFDDSGMSTYNYDQTIKGWAKLSLQNDVELGAANIEYCQSGARQLLIDDFNWTIIGDIPSSDCPFITMWKTDNPGSSNDNQITIPTTGTGYNYTVDWGDGTSDIGVTGDITHTYSTTGTYMISISSDFPRIYFNNLGDKEKILTIEQWGDIEWTSMINAFFGCSNLEVTASDAPDLSGVSSLQNMFQQATSMNADLNHWDVSTITAMTQTFAQMDEFNGNITSWDVSNVTNMQGMFAEAISFNQPIGNWNVSNVTNMLAMFKESNFNQDISGWDVNKVEDFSQMFNDNPEFNQNINSWSVSSGTDMSRMFRNAASFNQPLNNWNTGNVTNMSYMFDGASVFNQDLNTWNTSKVTTMRNTFANASSFNGEISFWDVSKVENMSSMFYEADSFNQPIGDWNTSSVTTMLQMFRLAESFNQNLDHWDVSKVETFAYMFANTLVFNGQIASWDVSSAEAMNFMFFNAIIFNQDIGSWNTENVLTMADMFNRARGFNHDIGSWDVSAVTNMSGMFFDADDFDRDLSSWNISLVSNMSDMFSESGLSTTNYDYILEAWSALSVQGGVTFGAANTNYCNASAARGILTNAPNNWVITDAGENCVVNIPDANFKAALLANASINTTDDGEITFQEAEVVNNLQLAGQDITDFTGLEAFTALNVLAANGNNLTSIDLSNNESLDFLSLSGNDLTEIDLSSNPTLLEVILSNNQLTEINLSNNLQITTLWIDRNDISSIDVSNNLLLEDLRVDRNPNLSVLNISNNDQLTVLHAYSCNYSDLDVSNNTLLEGLFIYDNPITALDLSGLTNLDDLRVGGLSISSLDLSDSPNLRFLFATGMGLNSLTLASPSLVQLFIQDNNLTGALDLSTSPNLTTVRIEQNDFSQLDLRNGNNAAITNFNTTDNPNLTCILVDDVEYFTTNFTDNIDTNASFNTVCLDPQTLTFEAIGDQFFEAGSLTLSATTSSELEVNYEVVSGPATLDGNIVSFADLGMITIRATQAGNEQFLPADPVEQSFEVITVTNVEDELSALQFYPNPVESYLEVNIPSVENIQMSILAINGVELIQRKGQSQTLDLSSLKSGIYFLRVTSPSSSSIHKIVKR